MNKIVIIALSIIITSGQVLASTHSDISELRNRFSITLNCEITDQCHQLASLILQTANNFPSAPILPMNIMITASEHSIISANSLRLSVSESSEMVSELVHSSFLLNKIKGLTGISLNCYDANVVKCSDEIQRIAPFLLSFEGDNFSNLRTLSINEHNIPALTFDEIRLALDTDLADIKVYLETFLLSSALSIKWSTAIFCQTDTTKQCRRILELLNSYESLESINPNITSITISDFTSSNSIGSISLAHDINSDLLIQSLIRF